MLDGFLWRAARPACHSRCGKTSGNQSHRQEIRCRQPDGQSVCKAIFSSYQSPMQGCTTLSTLEAPLRWTDKRPHSS